MAELNKSNKQTINVNTYRFASGQTLDEILKSQTSWATDEQFLLNMIDSDWRAVEDFITEKEKELAKKIQAAANNPETDLKLLAVQSEVATQYLCQKHTNQELWEKARNDPNGRTRPYSKDVVNVENQINFPYELPSWIKNSIEEIPSNWFERTPQQLQKEQEKEEIITAQAAVATGLSYEEWEEMLNDNEIAEERIEQIQVNGGMNEAAIQAEISASENKKADWIDSDGNPHWNDEEEIDEPVDMAGYEFDEYIHSDEFIEKFGDWEKANRLEKLKESKSLILSNQIIIHGIDVTEQINTLRNNPSEKSIKELDKYVSELGKEMINNFRLEQNISPYDNPVFIVGDDKKSYKFIYKGIKEIKHHNILQKGHIEGIYNIPEIIQSSIYIGTEKNEDNRKPELKRFYYYGLGIQLDNEDYTAKVVFTENNQGEVYYDQSLSNIEKGKFVDLIKNEPDAFNRIKRPDSIGPSVDTVHPHKNGWNSINEYYDRRLFRICQVPQLPYMEKNPVTNKWQPTEKAVELVKSNLLHIEKNGQEYRMIDSRLSQNQYTENSNEKLIQTEKELANAKKTIQEQNKELDIWTAKAQADKETINNLTEQLEQKDKIIQKQDEALRKEQYIHNSSCDITVPQRDSNGNEIIGKDGKPLTSTLHCTEGIDAALGKLSRKCVDLTLENKQLREQLNQEKNRNANSQSDNSSWSD